MKLIRKITTAAAVALLSAITLIDTQASFADQKLHAVIQGATDIQVEGCLYSLNEPGTYLFSATLENTDAAPSAPFELALINSDGETMTAHAFAGLSAHEAAPYAVQFFYEGAQVAQDRQAGRDDDERTYAPTICLSNDD